MLDLILCGWSFGAYNADTDERLDTDLDTHLAGKQTFRAILECKGLWFFGGRVGCSWHVKQLEYQPVAQKGALAFRDEGEDEIEEDEIVEDEIEEDEIVEEEDEIVEDSDVE